MKRPTGKGRVFGVKFRPGGFYPLWKRPVSRLTDRSVGLPDVFGPAGRELEYAVVSETGDEGAVRAAEDFLRRRLPERDVTSEELGRLVDLVASDRSVLRVEDLARLFGRSPRTLQRLFDRYVGVGPKWIIRRYRLQEAADLISADSRANLADLALALGYFDQAHFTKDFGSLVGVTPAEYARRQASGFRNDLRDQVPTTAPEA